MKAMIGCGTALTIDLVEGLQHLGGYILPNLYLQRDSLIQNTKGIKIPDSAFDNLKPGHNTVDAVHHGILLGLISTIDQIMQQSPKKSDFWQAVMLIYLLNFSAIINLKLNLIYCWKGLRNYVQLNSALTKVWSICNNWGNAL